jgi:hypothetical protein
MYLNERPDGRWQLLEVIKGFRRPVSDQFRDPRHANAHEQACIGRQLRLLEAAGIPPDRSLGAPILEPWFKWQAPDGHRHSVYVLKARPSHWRLYCVIGSQLARQIVFILAVKKKEQSRDPADKAKCEQILEGLHSGRFEAAPLPVPGSRGQP